MPRAKGSSLPDVPQYSRNATRIGLDLNRGPWEIVRATRILRLDTYKISVAVSQPSPATCPGMIAPSGGDHIEGTVATEAQLRERAREV
jgi:hypothetical protein